jgi:hypothetical protein
VTLTPERDFGWILERTQKTGVDGKYSFEGVPPGRYSMSIRRDINHAYRTTSEPAMSDSEERVPIDLPEGGHVTRDLKINN